MEFKVIDIERKLFNKFKREVCKFAKVKPEAIKIQSIYYVDDALVIRYAYSGMLLAYLNDPNEKPRRSIQFVMTCDNFLGDYLEDRPRLPIRR